MGADITLLYPELQLIVNQFLEKCNQQNLNVLITQTWRTKEYQDSLYAQGRTQPGSIITNCKYPQSPHCWGLAFDFCRNVKGQEYDDSDGFFKKVGIIGKSFGCAWGGDWTGFVDKPHLEIAKYLPNNSVITIQNKYGTPEAFKKTWDYSILNKKEVDDEMVTKTKILFNNQEIEIDRILKDDTNYIKLRDLEKIGLKVGYDSGKNMPIITK